MGELYSRKPGWLLALALCAGLTGCAASHFVRPLGRGNGVVTASVGGPFVRLFGAAIPTPILDLGGGYGVRDDLDVYAHVDATALAFGVLHVEPGFALHPLVRDGGWVPTVTVGTSLHLLTNFREARAVPQLTVAAAWRIARKHLIYIGGDLGFGFQPEGFRPLGGPFVGGEARIGRVGLTLELKWLSPAYDTEPVAPDWVSPDSHGYLSLLIGVNVYLGKVTGPLRGAQGGLQ
jgi:hypothetical protein